MAITTGNAKNSEFSNSKLRPFLVLWLPVFIWAGIIFYFSSIPSLRISPDNLIDLILRKGAHMFVFGVLAALLLRAFRFKYWPLTLLLTIAYAISDEFHQGFVSNRHPAFTDVLFDTTGAIIGTIAATIFKKQIQKYE